MALIEGVEKCGFKWSQISDQYPHRLARRPSMQLKDKWRNLRKAAETGFSFWRGPQLTEDLRTRIRNIKDYEDGLK